MKIKYIKNTNNIKYNKNIININFYQNETEVLYDDKDKKFINVKIRNNNDSDKDNFLVKSDDNYDKDRPIVKNDDNSNTDNNGISKLSERDLMRILKKSIMESKKSGAKTVIFNYFNFIKLAKQHFTIIVNEDKFIQNITTYILIAAYKFEKYQTIKTNKLEEILIVGDIDQKTLNLLKLGEIYGESTNMARDLSNIPANDMTPEKLAKFTTNIFVNKIKNKQSNYNKVKVKILKESECKALNMNLFCAVGQGSVEDSKLIVIEYMGGQKDERPIVFVGKGITFDTGGLNLKLRDMKEMIMDMTGGATVISAVQGIIESGIKKNVIAIVPALENALSGSSYRPGDIITSMSGITVEINNTDAEGRLVLADAITYSERYNPRIIVDIATLTGASMVALGEKASCVISFDKDLRESIINIAENNHEYMFALPAWEEYRGDIKSDVADISNINNKKAYGADAITGGMFIYEFVNKIENNKRNNFKNKKPKDKNLNNKKEENISWMHIDIAPRMMSNYQDNLEYGALGEPVKTLIDIAKLL